MSFMFAGRKHHGAILDESLFGIINSSVSIVDMIKNGLDKLYNNATTLLRQVKQSNVKNFAKYIFYQDLNIDTLKINTVTAKWINDMLIEESRLISLTKDQYLNNVEAKSVSVDWLLADHLKTKKFNGKFS